MHLLLEVKQVPTLDPSSGEIARGVFAKISMYPGMIFTSTKLFSRDCQYIGENFAEDERCMLFYINEAIVSKDVQKSPINVKFIEGCVVTVTFICGGDQLFIDYGDQYQEQRDLEGYESYADYSLEDYPLILKLKYAGKNTPSAAHQRAWDLEELKNTNS